MRNKIVVDRRALRRAELLKKMLPAINERIRVTDYVKPYFLKFVKSNRYITAKVQHYPSKEEVCVVSTREKVFQHFVKNTSDMNAAAQVGKVLAERLSLMQIPGVAVHRQRGQSYHGKIRAIIDNLRNSGIKLI